MSWPRVGAARLRGLFTRRRLERQLDEEVRFHLEMQREDHLARGMSPEDARRAALRSFGGVEPMKERYRERRTFASLETLAQDIRYAVRTLARNPAFTAAASLTLALAIGACTAMFSVVNAVLLRPLPFPSPDQLAMLWIGAPGQNPQGRPSLRTVEEWRHSQSFADMAVLDPVSVTLAGRDGAEQMMVARVSPNFLPLLGVQPLYGRMFSNEEADERRRVALISERFWRARFGGSLEAIGAFVSLDGQPTQVIGVLPASFNLPRFNAEVWEPYTLFPDWETRRSAPNAGSWLVFGRLKPAVTIDQAQAEMSAMARAIDERLPAAERNRGVSVVPLSLYVVGLRSRLALWTLTGAVLCVLLIAAFNVAGLSLARSAGRAREMAVRATLGASPARIVRQLVVEGLTLAALAGTLGTLLALAAIHLIRSVGPPDLPRLDEASLDLTVLAWTSATSLFAGLLVGIAPAITASRRSLRPSSEDGGRSVAGGPAARRIRRALVVAELALAIVLTAGAGLLIRSWWEIARVDPGFRPERVLSLQLAAPPGMAPAQRVNYFAAVVEQVEAVPGVESAGLVGDLFISNDAEPLITLEGSAAPAAAPGRVRLRVDEASERFFATIGTRLIRGRFFAAADGPDAPRVAILNETMARHVWPGRDPVGTRFKFGPAESRNPWLTIVGVVADMRRQGPETEPIAQVFLPLAQDPSRLETMLVRTSTEQPLTLAGAVQAAVRRVNKDAPPYGVSTLSDRLGTYLTQRRFQTSLSIGFSVVALLMAAIGIYGLLHYTVAARTQEIGIRMAIGARAADVFRMIVREGLQMTALGLALGFGGALLVGRAGSSLLFGVTATDPWTFAAVFLLLAAVALAACYFPARRATKVEPIVALRHT